jgi:hypothetical protein
MRILLLGFFTLFLFVPIFANAQFSTSDNLGNDMTDSLSKTGDKIIKIATKIADLIIETQLTDEEIDEELSKFSPVTQEIVVEKLKEMGYDYNGEFSTAYDNKMKEKE